MMKRTVVVIGAGVVGLSVACGIAELEEEVYILEKNPKYGMETSSRNSGVIHAGIYYPKNSLKAKLCVEGNRMLYEFCKKYDVPHKKLGKLIVATNDEEIETLEELFKRAEENGVQGLKILDKKEIKKMESFIEAERALFSPSTGIVDPDALMYKLLAIAEKNGAYLLVGNKVTSVIKSEDKDRYEVSGIVNNKKFSVEADVVINCAGLEADKIAETIGIDIDKAGYRLEYYKGDYFRINGQVPIKRLIYPVPPRESKGLGIHITPDLYGTVRLGPNAYEVNEISYEVQSDKDEFRNDVKRFFPLIEKFELEEDFAGIRPKLRGSGFKDFIIKHETDKGFFGFINLIGIESPGLTSCLSIWKYVKEIYENEILA